MHGTNTAEGITNQGIRNEGGADIRILPAPESVPPNFGGLIEAMAQRCKGDAGALVSRMLHAGYTSSEIIQTVKKYYSINRVCEALVRLAEEGKA